MTKNLRELEQGEFESILNQFLLPSSPIRTEERLRGRVEQLRQISQALSSPGRHVFIFGERGVGKTSLAQTAAWIQHPAHGDPVLVGCDPSQSFFAIAKSIVGKLLSADPTIKKRAFSKRAAADFGFLSVQIGESIEHGAVPLPGSVDEAVNLFAYARTHYQHTPVVVVDEFDRIEADAERSRFGDFVKQLGDQGVDVKLIFCGVGESLAALLAGHNSSFRYLASIELHRLDWEPRVEILDAAADALGIAISRDYLFRCASISDGFPHYIHLIGTKLFWSLYHSEGFDEPLVDANSFTRAISEASQSVEPQLRSAYSLATQKYSDDYEYILWAMADHPDLRRRSSDVYDSLCRIMTSLGLEPLDRVKFNNRMNALKQESHGRILTATRQGWYEFREPVLRGYCRLRAEQRNVLLDRDHYLSARDKRLGRS